MSGVVQIRVAGTPVGIIGLSEIFEEAVQRAVKPDEEGALTLLELVERVNYVPQPARADYAASLLREFRRFLGEDVPNASAWNAWSGRFSPGTSWPERSSTYAILKRLPHTA